MNGEQKLTDIAVTKGLPHIKKKLNEGIAFSRRGQGKNNAKQYSSEEKE